MKKQRLLFMFFSVSAALRLSAFCWLLCCSVILSLSKEAFAFTLPDTGQTKCYDIAGTEISCTGTGQDGAYSINPMSYTDNGNGTITDNVTGLMWQKGENTMYNWYQASGTYDATNNPSSKNACGSLGLAGYSDWRLPTKKELITLVDYGIGTNLSSSWPTINTTYFPNAKADYYWSSNTYASYTDYAWAVLFDNGSVDDYRKTSNEYVRCVRGGQTSVSFTDNGNETVTDNSTGLIWQQGEPGKMDWTNALTYCEGLSLGGQTDWRLPNIKELASITDDTTFGPAINTTYFPNATGSSYWSSTTWTYESFYDTAWTVNLGYGHVYNDYIKTYSSYYVRCIRSGQSGSSTQNNCAASISSSLIVHIPILTYNGSNYWADLQYNSSTGLLTVANAGAVSDASSYSSCKASTLSSDFKLHIPVLMLNGVSYWLDLQYNGSVFTVAGAGQN